MRRSRLHRPAVNSNRNYEVFWGETKEKRAFEDRHASTQAYIEYMRPRCVELARVLKKTGSFYYHCDWHASHYVKVMLDQIFGENDFRNEIVWKRASTVKGNAGQGSKLWSPNTDSILFYTKNDDYTWTPNPSRTPREVKLHNLIDDDGGFTVFQMIGPGGAGKWRPRLECMGVTRVWLSKETMARFTADGRIQSSRGRSPSVSRTWRTDPVLRSQTSG